LGEALAGDAIFIIDSMPLPVCRRARAWRCKKVRGAEYCGYCAAKCEKFFGWRLHLVITPDGIPASFDLLPASFHRVPFGWHDADQRVDGAAADGGMHLRGQGLQ